MAKKLRKSIKIYLSKLKKLHGGHYSSSLLSCKHPKTPSFSLDRHVVTENPNPSSSAATLADVDRFLCENFHSLYPDGITGNDIKPSDRFFVSPRRTSSSLLVTSSSSLSSYAEAHSVAVTTLSTDPYHDFKRSMKKMIDSGGFREDGLDWDFMEELLFCYLDLNDKPVHKYILKAFTDLGAGFPNTKGGVKTTRAKLCGHLEQT